MKDEKGSLTIEAAFVLSFFVIAMLSWMLLMRTVKVQSMMQHALDQTALTMSDQISMGHTLAGNEGALEPFLEKAKTILHDWEGSGDLQDTMEKAWWALDSNVIFPTFFGKGQGLAEEIHGMHMDTSIDDDADLLTLSLSYDMTLPGLLKPMGPVFVEQTSTSGLWLLTDDPVSGLTAWNENGNADGSDDSKDKPVETSIWQKQPLERGHIFLERRRELLSAKSIQMGKHFDLLHTDGSLESALSINLFSPTYSIGTGTDPSAYVLNEETIARRLKGEIQKMEGEMAKPNNTIHLSDGTELPIAGRTMRLFVIVPEEARAHATQLVDLAKRISAERGVRIEWHYEEKALLPRDKETLERRST